MNKYILIGCDIHEKTLVLRWSLRGRDVQEATVANAPEDRAAMVQMFQTLCRKHRCAGIHFAYEASGLGFGLYDQLTDAGMKCYVLAPSAIPRSPKHASSKSDGRDAARLLEILSAHVVAGNRIPDIWVPDKQTRSDRDLLRLRQDLGHAVAAIKSRIKSLLRLHDIPIPEGHRLWGCKHMAWLKAISRKSSPRSPLLGSSRLTLASLLRRLESTQKEIRTLDGHIKELAETPRYATLAKELIRLNGVGLMTAMVFLTEIGDPRRFRNRKQLAGFLGIVPRSHESGKMDDCKGHITRQGPGRVRGILCQATWAAVRTDAYLKAVHRRIAKRNPRKRKIAIVAIMRRLALRMWHVMQEHWPEETPAAEPAAS